MNDVSFEIGRESVQGVHRDAVVFNMDQTFLRRQEVYGRMPQINALTKKRRFVADGIGVFQQFVDLILERARFHRPYIQV